MCRCVSGTSRGNKHESGEKEQEGEEGQKGKERCVFFFVSFSIYEFYRFSFRLIFAREFRNRRCFIIAFSNFESTEKKEKKKKDKERSDAAPGDGSVVGTNALVI